MSEQTIIERRYGARAHAPFDVGMAQQIGEELEVVAADKPFEALTAEEIVEAAAKGDAPTCAKVLTWDDAIAGHRWRLHEARLTLNHLTVIEVDEEGEEVEIRAFQAIFVDVENGEAHTERRYVPLQVIREETNLVAQVIAEAEAELKRARAKLAFYKEHIPAELARVVDVIDEELGEE